MTRPSRSCRSEPQGLDLPGPEHGSSSFHLAHFPFRWCSQNDPRLRAEGVRQTSFPFAPYSGSQGSKGIVSSASSSSVAAFERFGVGRAPEPIPRLNSTGSLESVSSAYASYAKSRNDAALAQRDCRKWLFSWFSSVILRPQLSGQPTIPTASGKFMQACRKDTLERRRSERFLRAEGQRGAHGVEKRGDQGTLCGRGALTWCIGCAALRRTIPGRSSGYGVRRPRDDTSKKHVDALWSDAASPSSKRCNRPTSDGASQALNSQWRRTRSHGN